MSSRQWTELIDDFDGETEGVQTITFGLHGKNYEIELCPGHQAGLEEALAPFIEHARLSVSDWVRRRSPNTKKAAKSPSAAKKPEQVRKEEPQTVVVSLDTSLIRAWANENGIPVAAKGRIPSAVIAQYQAASA